MNEIPFDEVDLRYHRSFQLNELENGTDAKTFFEEFGFVIVRDVLVEDECEALIADMIALLKEKDHTIDEKDLTTWDGQLSRFGMPWNTKGLIRSSLLRMRQKDTVCRSFAAILGTEDIVCSHDRWLLHRPAGNHKEWVSPKNVHLDLNPFIVDSDEHRDTVFQRLEALRYSKEDLGEFITENNDFHKFMGLCVQGIVNLRDLPFGRGGGGTLVVPGSHKPGQWPPLREDQYQTGPMQYGIDRFMADVAQCVGLRAGSLLIWNQRLIHGSTPNMSKSIKKLRVAVPVRFFCKEILRQQPERAKHRAATIERHIEKCDFVDEVSDIGRSVFGLDLL